MAERKLDIQLRLLENVAANNRLLANLEQRITKAVNPQTSVSGGTRAVPPILALHISAAIQAQNQLKVIQERANADMERLRARDEANEAQHQRRMAEIALQGTRRRVAAQPTVLGRLTSPNVREAGESIQQSGQAYTQYLTRPILNVGQAAVRSALDIDVFRSRLTALEGSAEAANVRLAKLRQFALNSPGVTFQSAADQYSLLKATTDLLPASIERVIASVGKLNAAFKIDDVPLFTRNLQQIFTKNFDTKDIREAAGRVPIFSQILEKAFGSSDPEQLRKLKASGKITAESYFKALGDAINSDSRIGNIQENLSARFEKLIGRAQTALEPLGNAVLNVLGPVVERAVPLVEGLGAAFGGLPAPIQLTIVALAGATAALGPFLEIVGAGVQALQVFQITKTVKDLQSLTGALSGTAKVASIAEAAAVASASGFAQFASGMTAASSAASATAVETAAVATGFSLLNPVVLGIVAVLAVAALAATSYAGELDKANKITTEQVTKLAEQQKTYQTNIASLREVTKTQGDTTLASAQLNQTLAALDPVTRNYANGLGSVQEKAAAVSRELERLRDTNTAVLKAQQATFVQGILAASGEVGKFTGELQALSVVQRQYEQQLGSTRNATSNYLLGLRSTQDQLDNTNRNVSQSNEELEKYKKNLDDNVPKLVANARAQGQTAEAVYGYVKSLVQNKEQAEALQKAFAPYIGQLNQAGNAAQTAADKTFNLAAAIKEAGLSGARSDIAKRVEDVVVAAQGNVQKAVKQLRDEGIDKSSQQLRGYEKAVKTVSTQIGLMEVAAGASAKAIDSIAKNVAKLRLEVNALQAGGGKVFDLEIEREQLSTTKSQLLDIIKLRRELGERQGESLPDTQAGRESELRLLNLDKRTREEILKLTEQQAEFEARITIEQARRKSAVPSAEQRTALKLEEDANKAREDGIDLTSRWLTLQARLFISSSVNAKAAKDAADAVPLEAQERIVAANKELAILTAVADARTNDTNRELEELALLKEAKVQLLKDEESASKEIGAINAKIAAGLISNETAIALYRSKATLQRLEDEQRTVASMRDLEDQLLALRAGSGLEAVLNRGRDIRLQSEKQTLEQLLVLRAEDRDNFTRTEEYKRSVVERAELSRRQAARQTSDEIITLQEEIAHAAEGAADRYQAAYLRAIRNIQQEDEQANVRLLENQIKLARQTEVRYDRLNDKVVDLLASQKGLTETFQDFRANTVKDTFDLLDKGVDKITKRFGALGDSVKQLLKDLLRLAATKLFEKVLGLTPQQAPQGASGFNLGGLLQPGASRGGNGFSIGGFNFGSGGIGPGGTGTFSGAPVSFGGNSATGGGGGGISLGGINLGGLRNVVSRIPGLGGFFNRSASAATVPFSSVTPAQIGGLSYNTTLSKAAGALPTFGNVPVPAIGGGGTTAAAAAPSAFAGLGATGLLAAGGLLGSLAGGKSKVGQLLGGLGGTLGAGAIGASGLLGGGIAASFGTLAPLLTNPITAVVAAGLIGTALLVRAFANRDLKKLAGTIKEVHAIDVPTKGEGLSLLEEVKKIGQSQYGKKWLDQRGDLVKQQNVIDILTQYAVGTGQNNSPLVRNKQLADPFNDANNFVRRLNGGPIPGPTLGRDHIPALLDGSEYVSAARTVQREGVSNFAALDNGTATIALKGGGGGAEMAALKSYMDARDRQFSALVADVHDTLSGIRGIPADHQLAMGLERNPGLLVDALSKAQTSGNLYAFTDKLNQ